MRRLATTIALVAMACASSPPSQVENVCGIFDEKKGIFDNWHRSAQRAQREYGVPISVLMATVHQESRFQPRARPPRTRLLWFIPWKRPSSAYGFAQAVDTTWDRYVEKTGNRGADRDKFKDAIDFVGWYHHSTHRRNRVALGDTYHLYLAYHEGQAGFARRTYESKSWLREVARKVERRARLYEQQYQSCRKG